MSFPTQPAFVAYAKGWDEGLLQHPMMKFLWEHEKLFDGKKHDEASKQGFYTTDVGYTRPNGTVLKGEAAIQGLIQDYALFHAYFHEPVYGVIHETADGYRLFGYAKMFVNLPVPGDKIHTDLSGRGWEVQGQGAFIFDVVKDSSGPLGLKFKNWQTFADPTPILGEAIKRGIVPIEAITGSGA